jgi:RecA-family ATPase
MFIDAEDEAAELHRRLANILDHYSAPFADAIKGGLHMMSLAGQDAVLAAPHRTGKIEPTALFKRFLQAAGDLKPKMIGIASSANVYAGSEIDRAQVQQFLSLMTKLAIAANGAVVLDTHPSLTGINSDSGLSGSPACHNSSLPSRPWHVLPRPSRPRRKGG